MSTNDLISGYEPRLSASYTRQGKRLLPLSRLANMLEVLPPSAITLEVLAEALKSDTFYVRYAAARILNQRGDRAARVIMQTILNEGNIPSRATVARYLYGFSWFAIEPLIHQALNDADARVREGAIYALCDARELKAFQLMARVLQTEVDSVREAAAWGLRECRDPAAIPALEAVLLATDPDVRVKALEVLGANGMPQAAPAIRQAIHDSHPDVQYAAALSLLEISGAACLGELAQIIQTSVHSRQAVLKGLFHATNYLKITIVGSPAEGSILDALETAIHDEQPQTREAAIWPLAWIQHARASDILLAAYGRESDPDVQRQFIRITASLGAPAAADILQQALNSQDHGIRAFADEISDTVT
ncbi:MAG: HEAT repeat domain-containing protein [Anaerolineae bacterium]